MRLRPCFRAVDNTLCSEAKSCAPPLRAERARNLHVEFHHADVPLRLIVHERHSGIVQEAQCLRLAVARQVVPGSQLPVPLRARLRPRP